MWPIPLSRLPSSLQTLCLRLLPRLLACVALAGSARGFFACYIRWQEGAALDFEASASHCLPLSGTQVLHGQSMLSS